MSIESTGNSYGSIAQVVTSREILRMKSNGSFEVSIVPKEFEIKTYQIEISITSSYQTKSLTLFIDVDLDGLDAKYEIVFLSNPNQLDTDNDEERDVSDDTSKITPSEPKGFISNNEGVTDECMIVKLEERYPSVC